MLTKNRLQKGIMITSGEVRRRMELMEHLNFIPEIFYNNL